MKEKIILKSWTEKNVYCCGQACYVGIFAFLFYFSGHVIILISAMTSDIPNVHNFFLNKSRTIFCSERL